MEECHACRARIARWQGSPANQKACWATDPWQTLLCMELSSTFLTLCRCHLSWRMSKASFLAPNVGGDFKYFLKMLGRSYIVHWDLLSPHTHASLAHHRIRIFFVGLRRDCKSAQLFTNNWQWPATVACKSLAETLCR